MMKIKVAENFYSCQFEGQYMGVPSVFLRTFGCNFRCKKFGLALTQKVGKYNPEVETIINNIDNYKQFKDLPLVSTGCDTYAAIYPEFKHLSPTLTISEIVDEFQRLLPGGKFSRDKHLVITGGEPLLGWQRAYIELINEIYRRDMDLMFLTFETNGTMPLSDELCIFLNDTAIEAGLEVTFSISPKLLCSGEKWEDSIHPDIVRKYISVSNNRSYLKFVVATQQDVDDAKRAIVEYELGGVFIPVYLMPVGGVDSVYNLNERQVADYCRDNGLRFSPRMQVTLYRNEWGS